jgi:hypothetical protein
MAAIEDLDPVALIELRIAVSTDWRTGYSTAPALPDLYAGDEPQPPSPHIEIWFCGPCNRRYLGQPLLQPHCEICQSPLQHKGDWNISVDGFGPLLVRRERSKYKKN